MCQFLSGIVFKRDGRLLADPLIDSHTLLQKRNNIHEQYESRDYCLVEITGNNADLDSYHLNWTQERKPNWWREEWDEALEARAKQIIAPLCINGNLIREGVEWSDGTKAWYLNGNLHREDGPAIEDSDGTKHWYLNGLRHREDGPAIEYSYGTKAWYLNGNRLTESEFNNR